MCRTFAALYVASTVVSLTAPAVAKVEVRTIGRVSTAVTSNVDASPVARADGYTEIEPSLLLATATARFVNQLQLSLAGSLFYDNFEANSTLSGRLDWIGLWEASESIRVRLGSSGSVGRQSLLSTGASAGSAGGVALATPSGSEWFASASLSEGLDWELAPDWTFDQDFGFDFFAPFTSLQPTTVEGRLGLGVARGWDLTQIGLRASQAASVSTAYTEVTQGLGGLVQTDLPRLVQLTTRGVATLGQRLAEAWSMELSAGVLRVADAEFQLDQIITPTGTFALRYAEDGYEGEATLDHTARQSLFIGQSLLVQELRLRARMPLLFLDRPARWFAEGTLGYEHGQRIDFAEQAITGDHIHSLLIDIGGIWRQNDSLEWTLRYQFTQQWVDEFDPTTGQGIPNVLSFDRHLIIVACRYGYPPERVRTRLPTERTRVGRDEWRQFFNPEAPPTPRNEPAPTNTPP